MNLSLTDSGLWDFQRRKVRVPGRCAVQRCRNAVPANQRDTICGRCKMRRWRRNHPVASRLKTMRDKARKRRIPFDLTAEWVLQQCQGNPAMLLQTGNPRSDLVFDRIDPLLGYTTSNVRITTAEDNSRKGATFDKAAWVQQKIDRSLKARHGKRAAVVYVPDGPVNEFLDDDNEPF
jgi:hypothetical protein